MSVRLRFAAVAGEAGPGAAEAEIEAFLSRLVRWDKAAVVRLRSAPGDPALGVFGYPPFGGVLAVKSMALDAGGAGESVEATVSAGELLEAVAEAAGGGDFAVPASVTGPAWAGLLPPRSGWRRDGELPGGGVRDLAARVVAEFRARTEALVPEQRTRAQLDALAEELWSRPVPSAPSGPEMTLRVVHAAHALGFLPAQGAGDRAGGDRGGRGGSGTDDRSGAGDNTAGGDDTVTVLSAGPWVRLRTAYGSVVMRRASAASGLSVSPR